MQKWSNCLQHARVKQMTSCWNFTFALTTPLTSRQRSKLCIYFGWPTVMFDLLRFVYKIVSQTNTGIWYFTAAAYRTITIVDWTCQLYWFHSKCVFCVINVILIYVERSHKDSNCVKRIVRFWEKVAQTQERLCRMKVEDYWYAIYNVCVLFYQATYK